MKNATIRVESRPTGADNEFPTVIIEASSGLGFLNFKELWEYRELLYFLIWRNIKVKYKQAALGASWAIIQPFFTMVVFSIFFGRLAKIPSDGLPYPIFAYAALVPWTYFSTSLAAGANSLVDNSAMISKVYFPRIVAPLSAVLSGLLDFALALIVLAGMMMFYGIKPTVNLVFLPMFVLLATATAFGVALWLSALNVQYRDVRHALPFIVQFWLFATPVAYPVSLVPGRWQAVFALNPMVGVVEGFRWMLLGKAPPGIALVISITIVLLLTLSGLVYFRRMESSFADVV